MRGSGSRTCIPHPKSIPASSARADAHTLSSKRDSPGCRCGISRWSDNHYRGIFVLFLRRKWQTQLPADFKLAIIGALLMLGMFAVLPISSVIADRLAYYLLPIQAMIFARLPSLPMTSNRKFHTAFPFILVGVTFIVWTSLSGLFKQCYLPYQTWLFGFPEEIICAF